MSNILKTGLHRSKKNVGGSIGVIVMHRRLKYIDFYNCKWMVAEWFPPKSSFSCDNSYKVKFSLVLGAGMRSRNRVNLIFISLQTLHLFNPWGMPFLGGSCIKDAREQGRNRTCYLWKKSEIRENTFWNYRKENIFPEGKKISNPKINGFFFTNKSVFSFSKITSLYCKWKRRMKCASQCYVYPSAAGKSECILWRGLLFDISFAKLVDFSRILFFFWGKKPPKQQNNNKTTLFWKMCQPLW